MTNGGADDAEDDDHEEGDGHDDEYVTKWNSSLYIYRKYMRLK